MKKILLSLFVLLSACKTAHAGFQDFVQGSPYFYKFASNGGSVTVKSTSGILHALTVTGGTTSPIDVYDGTAVSTAQIASYTTTNTPQTYIFDVAFTSGCTVVTNAGLKYTVSYL